VIRILGTGHPWHEIHGKLTPLPLLGLCLTLVLIRFVLRRPLGIVDLVAAFFLGALFSTAADTWGLTVTFSLWFLSAMALSVGRARGAFGGRPPD
jgi:hypothetical protein